MDLIQLLKETHEHLLELLLCIDGASSNDVSALVRTLEAQAKEHWLEEKEFLFGVLSRREEVRRVLQEAEWAHQKVLQLAGRLVTLSPSDAYWSIVYEELKEQIRHQISEEEDLLFKKIRSCLKPHEYRQIAHAIGNQREPELPHLRSGNC